MTFWNATWEVARKEIMQHIRTKRLLVIAGLIVASLVLITIVIGPRIVRGEDIGPVANENFVMLAYFSTILIGGYFFIQLMAIVLTADAVCSEWSNRTIFLLLSKPVSRTAFVLGKLLGSTLTLAVTIVVLFSLDYLIIQGMYAGSPTAAEVGGFFAALGVIILGAAAYAAMALFFSTVTRSTVMALLFTLGMWIIVFPILGQVGLFIELSNNSPNPGSAVVEAWHYVNPGNDMAAAGKFLVSNAEVRAGLEFLSQAPKDLGIAIAVLAGHIIGWTGLSLLLVKRRNFE